MAKVTIHRPDGDFTVEDISFEQVKELVGVNGYGSHAPQEAVASTPAKNLFPIRTTKEPDFRGFLAKLSERGRLFTDTLRHHRDGIEANLLAGKLGFRDSRQIGGLTGGGIAKAAKGHGIRLKDIYRVETTFPNGTRTVKFYPGKLILGIEQEKPAI